MQLLLIALLFLCNVLTKLAHFYGVKYNIIQQKVLQISNMIIDKHQHMHFFTFKTVLV